MSIKEEEVKDNNLEKYEEVFKDEIEMIQEEMSEMDSLYEETKKHFDEVKGNPQRATLRFIQEQTSNLISMKDSKIKMIKSSVDVKKIISDFAYKYDKMENNDRLDTDLSLQLFERMMESQKREGVSLSSDDKDDSMDDEELNGRIEDLIANDEEIADEINTIVEGLKDEIDSDDEESSESIVSDLYGTLYVYDSDTNEITKEGVPEGLEVIDITIDEENDEYYVECSDGNKYEIVEIDLS